MKGTKVKTKTEVIQEIQDCCSITYEQALEAFHTAHYHITKCEAVALLKRKADLWDAFTSLGRIRTLGWAKLGEPGYQHIGFELWTMHGAKDFSKETTESIKNFEIFLDAWMDSQEVGDTRCTKAEWKRVNVINLFHTNNQYTMDNLFPDV